MPPKFEYVIAQEKQEMKDRAEQLRASQSLRERMHAINFIIYNYLSMLRGTSGISDDAGERALVDEIVENILKNRDLIFENGEHEESATEQVLFTDVDKKKAINDIIEKYRDGLKWGDISGESVNTIFARLPESSDSAWRPQAETAMTANNAGGAGRAEVAGVEGLPVSTGSPIGRRKPRQPGQPVQPVQGGGYTKGPGKSRKYKRRKNKSKRKKRTKRKRSKRSKRR